MISKWQISTKNVQKKGMGKHGSPNTPLHALSSRVANDEEISYLDFLEYTYFCILENHISDILKLQE